MTDFLMPSLGADMAAGTLVEWLVKPGDRVKKGDVIGVVETEKGAIEIEVFNAGTVAELVVPVGTRVPVGTVLARFDTGAAPTLVSRAAVPAEAAPAVAAAIAAPVIARAASPAAVPALAAAPPVAVAVAPPRAATPIVVAPALAAAVAEYRAPVPPASEPPVKPAAPPVAAPQAAAPPVAARPAEAPQVAARPAAVPAAYRAAGAHIAASPAARRLAAERGIALDNLAGSGPDGAVTLADVEAALAAPFAPAAAPVPVVAHEAAPRVVALVPPATAPAAIARAAAEARPAAPARRRGFDPAAMRQAIAAAMSRAKREIPHYYLSETVEVSAVVKRLEQLNSGRLPADRLVPAVLLLRATALALAKLPELNGFWEDGRFRPGDGIHIGWAISLRGGGLMAPAIHDADKMSLDELMAAMRDLVQRARTGGVRSSEMTDPTITVTSLGERGAESVLPIIYPPQVAVIGFGRIVTRPWVIDGAIGPRPVVALTLAGDHRASDGHRGGLLLAEIERLLQEVDTL